MSSSFFASPSSSSPKTIASSPAVQEAKQAKIIEKLVTDLEDLTQKLVEYENRVKLEDSSSDGVIRDDCLELQKFCSKLEIVLQFKLKERKGLLSAATSGSSSHNTSLSDSTNFISLYSNREYWSFFIDALKSSRSFQDAIKFVKNLNEVKTNIGKGRAFIRFCLHYHRLADAIQQLMMEDKIVKYAN